MFKNLIILIFGCLFAANTQAAYIYSFSGTVTSVELDLVSTFSIGDTITGSFIASDISNGSGTGGYGGGTRTYYPTSSLDVSSTSGYTLTGSGGDTYIETARNFGSEDAFVIDYFGATGATLNAIDINEQLISQFLLDFTYGFLGSDSLITNIDVSDPNLQSASGMISYGNYLLPSTLSEVNFTIDLINIEYIEGTAVPVPAAIWLMTSGLMFFVGYARKTNNNGGQTTFLE